MMNFMKRLEFNEVLNAVGIYNPLTTMTGGYGNGEEVHIWQNLAIYFGGSYYAVVDGKVPLEVANIIYAKYPNNPYGIRINGGESDWDPREYARDDQYRREIQTYAEQYLDADQFLANCRRSRRNLLRRKNENKYIATYHVDTKEGLLILLLEMKDYFARKQGLPETEVKRFGELMAKINFEIFNKKSQEETRGHSKTFHQ